MSFKKINNELDAAYGTSVDMGGYYAADSKKVKALMRPSNTFNTVIKDARIS